MFIILTGSELWTGNVFAVPTSLLSSKTRLLDVLHAIKNIAVVFIGNFFGAVFVGFFFTYLINHDSEDYWITFLKTLAEKKTTKNVGLLFVSAIGCNIVVSSAIYMMYTAEDIVSKIFSVFFPVRCFFWIEVTVQSFPNQYKHTDYSIRSIWFWARCRKHVLFTNSSHVRCQHWTMEDSVL